MYKKFQFYLKGRTSKCITDYKPLVEITYKKEFKTPKFERWMIKLQEFDFVIIHRPGKDLIMADALSRSDNDGNREIDRFIIRVHGKKIIEKKNLTHFLKTSLL